MAARPDMHSKARTLAKLGFSLIPLHSIRKDGTCSCGKPDCSSPGKHPNRSAPHGVKDASADPDVIDQWFVMGEPNIGIATGERSDVIVIDIDPEHGGDRSWQNLQDRYGEFPETWTVRTGSGGYHYYYQHVLRTRNRVGLFPGVDVRTDDGYVVAPPSLHVSGNRYEWVISPKDMDGPAVMPERLVQAMGMGLAGVDKHLSQPIPESITDGSRNNVLTSAAGTMRRRGFSPEAIKAAISIENQLKCKPPLDSDEVDRIAWSVSRYPAQHIDGITFGGRPL